MLGAKNASMFCMNPFVANHVLHSRALQVVFHFPVPARKRLGHSRLPPKPSSEQSFPLLLSCTPQPCFLPAPQVAAPASKPETRYHSLKRGLQKLFASLKSAPPSESPARPSPPLPSTGTSAQNFAPRLRNFTNNFFPHRSACSRDQNHCFPHFCATRFEALGLTPVRAFSSLSFML